MSVQRQSKKHHYLPKCYLRYFSPNNSESVFYIDLIGKGKKDLNIPKYIPSKECILKNIENFGYEIHRNTISDFDTGIDDTRLIEGLFDKFEKKYHYIMKCINEFIIDDLSINEVVDNDLILAINFICSIMLSRLPAMDDMFFNLNNKLPEYIDYLKNNSDKLDWYIDDSENIFLNFFDESFSEMAEFLSADADADADADAIRNRINESSVKLVKRIAGFIPILNGIKIDGFKTYILKSNPSLPFITSDFPFVIEGDKSTLSNGFIFVLSPSLALCRSINLPENFNSLNFAEYVNDQISLSAKRFMISNNKDVLNEIITKWHSNNALA